MRIEALYFAHLKDELKKEGETFDLPAGSTVSDLLEAVQNSCGKKIDSRNLKTAVNEEFEERDFPLSEGDRVALLPPVSGG